MYVVYAWVKDDGINRSTDRQQESGCVIKALVHGVKMMLHFCKERFEEPRAKIKTLTDCN